MYKFNINNILLNCSNNTIFAGQKVMNNLIVNMYLALILFDVDMLSNSYDESKFFLYQFRYTLLKIIQDRREESVGYS